MDKIESMKKVLEIQRACLTPEEQELFDAKKFLVLSKDDPRNDFLDFTDNVLYDLGYDPKAFPF